MFIKKLFCTFIRHLQSFNNHNILIKFTNFNIFKFNLVVYYIIFKDNRLLKICKFYVTILYKSYKNKAIFLDVRNHVEIFSLSSYE
jgi:hypothetical protein